MKQCEKCGRITTLSVCVCKNTKKDTPKKYNKRVNENKGEKNGAKTII